MIRDRDQREGVYRAQLDERRDLQSRFDVMRREQRSTLMQMARAIGRNLRGLPSPSQERAQEKPTQTLKPRTRGRDFDFGL